MSTAPSHRIAAGVPGSNSFASHHSKPSNSLISIAKKTYWMHSSPENIYKKIQAVLKDHPEKTSINAAVEKDYLHGGEEGIRRIDQFMMLFHRFDQESYRPFQGLSAQQVKQNTLESLLSLYPIFPALQSMYENPPTIVKEMARQLDRMTPLQKINHFKEMLATAQTAMRFSSPLLGFTPDLLAGRLQALTCPNLVKFVTKFNTAFENGHTEVVRMYTRAIVLSDLVLSQKEVLLHAKRTDGVPGLNLALQYGYSDVVGVHSQAIIQSKLDPSQIAATLLQAKVGGCPGLYVALQNGHKEVVEVYIQLILGSDLPTSQKVEILQAYANGISGLYVALQNGHKEAVQVFIEAILRSNLPTSQKVEILQAKNADGVSGLHIALLKNHEYIIKIYVDKVFVKDDYSEFFKEIFKTFYKPGFLGIGEGRVGRWQGRFTLKIAKTLACVDPRSATAKALKRFGVKNFNT